VPAGKGYRELKVWSRSRALAIEVLRATSSAVFRSDWGLRDQIRRAAISVPSNIAEGNQRGSNRDSIRFFYIARGSAAELATQLEIAAEAGLLESPAASRMLVECEKIGAMLINLIRARS
jgi:four helix bundle protein